jgi:hypothetical protein
MQLDAEIQYYIRMVLGSNLRRYTGYLNILRVFTQSVQANAGIVLRLGHDRFLPNPFQIISRHIIRLYVVSIVTAPLNN